MEWDTNRLLFFSSFKQMQNLRFQLPFHDTCALVVFVLRLHSVLALDPGCDVGSPSQGSTESAQDVVPLDPRSAGQGTWFLLKDERLSTAVHANGQEHD